MADVSPLVEQATRKSGLVWLGVPGQPAPVAAWHIWQDGAAYVVTGPGEQPAPGLADATTCAVTVRSTDTGGRIVTWQAAVSPVEPGGEQWRAVVPALLAGRLNLPAAAEAEERWARTCTVVRLAPTGDLIEAGDTLPDGSLATPPPPSPARSPLRVPFTLRFRKRRRRRSEQPDDPGPSRGRP